MCDHIASLCEVLCVFLKRFKSQMAALVAWIVGTISGGRDDKDQEESKTNDTETTKLKKNKHKAKKSPTISQPSFSTTLTTPIEEVIEETLNEEVKNSDIVEPKPARKAKKRKNKSKSSENVEDVIGYSFFKTKSAENIQLNPEKQSKPSPDSSNSAPSHQDSDPVGFSFLPVKDRRRKNQKPKIDDLPKSAIIEHFQTNKNKKPSSEKNKDEFVVIEKADLVTRKPQDNFVEKVNKETGKIVYIEAKESKKVHSKISYASVAQQRFEESLEQLKKEEERLKEEERNFSTNQKSNLSKDEDILIQTQNRNEELACEIQSEEQRLVDLLDEAHSTEEDQNSEELEAPTEICKEIDDCAIKTDNIKPESTEEEDTGSSEEREQSLVPETSDETHSIVRETSAVENFCSVKAADVVEVENYSSQRKSVHIEEVVFLNEDHTWVEVEKDPEELKTVDQETRSFETIEKTEELLENLKTVETHSFSQETSNSTVESFCLIKRDKDFVEESKIVENHQFAPETTEERELENEEDELAIKTVKDQPEKPFKMSSGTQIRVLTLNEKEHQDSTLYRLEKNWILQFRLGPSLLGRKVLLYCNYPKKDQDFDRKTYNLLKWLQDDGCDHSDDTALLTEITLTISGSFHYYFVFEDGEAKEHQGSGFFLVDPTLKYGNNEELPLDCIQCQTVLAKGLGPFDTWENKLKVAKESGYNMIHFTPIQELGASNSSYSLSEQLKINPLFRKQNGDETNFQDVERLMRKMKSEWKVISICDIVLNHTANESPWLQQHPEASYNCQNCPYMRPAYLLDAALHQFSSDVSKGLYEDKGIPPQVTNEDHLNAIRYHLHNDVLSKLKIHELYICDANKYVSEFLNSIRNKVPEERKKISSGEELKIVQDPLFRRLSSTLDMPLAVKLYNVYRNDCFDEETRIKKCAEDFKNKLDSLNQSIIDEITDHLNVAVENVIAGIRYFRVQQDGPKIREISVKNPLVSRYFTDHGTPKNLKEHEEVMLSDDSKFLMAHNGWVMNSDPLRNFAAPDSNVYLRRELIAWGDSVKLRFGDEPQDCPFLWEHMREYVELTARIFDGVRLDNCHSTPIQVAEYLLDCARKVNPNLYVVAELFTNSDMTDNIFVNRLGITSLIREAMSAWDSHEQGRLVYRYGGSPVGAFYQPKIRPLVPSIAHALFLDLTHDNPSPVEKRSIFDLLPSTALVNMACCASGSNRGYDELVPHHIHVVDETRQYTEWTNDDNLVGNNKFVTKKSGIIAAKKALNDLHYHLGVEGFNQVYVDQMDSDIVAVTRHCPDTHQSYVLVAFTAFSHPPEDAENYQRGIKPLRIEGVLDEIVLEASLNRINTKSTSKYAKTQNFHKDNKWINGLSEYQVHLKQHISPEDSEVFEKVDSKQAGVFQLNFKNFKPGDIAIIKVSLQADMGESIKNVRNLISQFSLKKENELWKIISEMTLPDLNRALYRCDQEERDEGFGFDTYDIPNFGRMVYAGFQGFMSLLGTIRPNNDLGHPMCANLRDGNWMIDYIWQRLKLDEGTKKLGQWFEENAKSLKSIPRYLVPCYFDVIVTGIYILLLEQSYNLMSDFVKHGSTFVKGLALGSIQFSACIKSADLPVLSPNLSDPKPPQRKNEKGENVQACVTLSAGLPHFSVGYMRNWGRDTFIALRGLFLLTGRFEDARYHILGYGACLRHGLIPNLLDGGRNPRFNCRDAVWWWLYCIKSYTEEAPKGLKILQDKVSRIFPSDDSPPQPAGTIDQTLAEVMQEALQVHFQGLVFRERNAGRQIDEHMTDQGFNNQIGIHPESGFVFGGNGFNCGTWMDKMGSSDKAGNRGQPATPRDGSAVELIGLSKAVVTWLERLSKEGVYPYSGVERRGKNGLVTQWSFKEWAEKIQNNFEKYFWVNTSPVQGEIRPDLINKRGIYKDCYGASQEWTDFQLRCNFPIAMVVAPELFDPKHAWVALKQAEKYLLGPLGMKTLDPEDWAYNGDYDNSNGSDNKNIANGFNYHQGPEWVWPVGFYLRAKLQFAPANNELGKTLAEVKAVLARHFVELQTSTWRGLPELTNKDGAFCKDSSRTQAWSMSCILEVLHDLQRRNEMGGPLIN